MRRLKCVCGGVIMEPVPTHCPHCGARIKGIRRQFNWLGPVLVVGLFAALLVLAFRLVGLF